MIELKQKAERKLANRVGAAFLEAYGSKPPKEMCQRIRKEWNSMMRAQQAAELLTLAEVADMMKARQYTVHYRSEYCLILELLGISRGKGKDHFVPMELTWAGEGHPALFELMLPADAYWEFKNALEGRWSRNCSQPAIVKLSGKAKTVYEDNISVDFGNMRFHFIPRTEAVSG